VVANALHNQAQALCLLPQFDALTLAELTRASAESASPALSIRDPYIFEFLGVKAKEVMAESDLEDALLDRSWLAKVLWSAAPVVSSSAALNPGRTAV
jgi:hypothetical protein